jgi:hypothetical protein
VVRHFWCGTAGLHDLGSSSVVLLGGTANSSGFHLDPTSAENTAWPLEMVAACCAAPLCCAQLGLLCRVPSVAASRACTALLPPAVARLRSQQGPERGASTAAGV